MSDPRTGIQTNKPIPPWELPGCFRRDGEPHRGVLLQRMGTASVLVSAAALTPCLFGLPVAFGLPLSLATWILARSDLSKMQKGLMDPAGKSLTSYARYLALAGLVLNIGSKSLLGLICLCSQWG